MLAPLLISILFRCGFAQPRGPELADPPVIDFNATAGVKRFIAKFKNITIKDQRNGNATVARFETRLFCLEGVGCTLPAATLKMYPSIPARLEMCNGLTGFGRENLSEAYVKELGYTPLKDQDIVNVHTHGLHVSPTEDDIVNRLQFPFCPANLNSSSGLGCIMPNATRTNYNCQLYNFTLPHYHYPGSHWWHSHWHGSVTLQVAGGMYGGISVEAPVGSPYKESNMPSNWFMIGYNYAVRRGWRCPCLAQGDRSIGQPVIGNNVKGPRARAGFPIVTRCTVACQYSQASMDATGMSYYMDVPGNYTHENGTEFYVVNGQYKPTKTLTTGTWHRFRIVVTAINYIFWQLNNYTACDAYLLGTDGISFDNEANGGTGPRDINAAPYFGTIVIPIGSRADVAVRCRMPGRHQIWALHTRIARSVQIEGPLAGESFPFTPIKASTRFSSQNHDALTQIAQNSQDCQAGAGQIGVTYFSIPTAATDHMLADLEVTGPQTYDTSPPPVNPMPHSKCMYLKDTMNIPVSNYTADTSAPTNPDTSMKTMNLVLPSRPLAIDQAYVPMATGMNNVSYNDLKPMITLQTNFVHEWTVYIRFHPFHHHTWPYQVQSAFPDFVGSQTGWFVQRGDWRDVVGLYGSLIVRVNYVAGGPDRDVILNNQLVVHCHFVFHEDWGMMEWFRMSTAKQPDMAFPPDANNSIFTLATKGSTTIGGATQTCQKTHLLQLAGRATVISNVLKANFSLEVARLGVDHDCFGVIFSGTSRPNIENFYVGYALSDQRSMSCANRTGLALRLQVFRENGVRRYQAIPVTVASPHYTANAAFLELMNMECLEPTEVLHPNLNSFSYNVTCFFRIPLGIPNNTFGNIFGADGGFHSFSWSYGEGVGSSAFPQYANQNVQTCPIQLLPVTGLGNNLRVIDTVCTYGYFNLLDVGTRFYINSFLNGVPHGAPPSGPAPIFNITGVPLGVVIGASSMLLLVLIVVGICYLVRQRKEREDGYVAMEQLE